MRAVSYRKTIIEANRVWVIAALTAVSILLLLWSMRPISADAQTSASGENSQQKAPRVPRPAPIEISARGLIDAEDELSAVGIPATAIVERDGKLFTPQPDPRFSAPSESPSEPTIAEAGPSVGALAVPEESKAEDDPPPNKETQDALPDEVKSEQADRKEAGAPQAKPDASKPLPKTIESDDPNSGTENEKPVVKDPPSSDDLEGKAIDSLDPPADKTNLPSDKEDRSEEPERIEPFKTIVPPLIGPNQPGAGKSPAVKPPSISMEAGYGWSASHGQASPPLNQSWGLFPKLNDMPRLFGPFPQRYRGPGQPLFNGSWLNRPYHVGWLVGTLIGGDPGDGFRSSSGLLGGYRAGIDISHYWGIEGRFAFSALGVTDKTTFRDLGTSDVSLFDLNLLYYPWGDSRWRPYWMLGLGTSHIDFIDGTGRRFDNDSFGIPIGFGVKYRASPWFVFRFDLVDNISVGGNGISASNNLSVTFGTEIRFGGTRQNYWPWRY